MRSRLIITVLVFTLICCFTGVGAPAQPTKLVLWSHWASEPIKINFMNAVTKAFEQETGIQVEIVWMEKDQLVDKLVFAFDTPEPDLAYIDLAFSHPRILRSLADLSGLTFGGVPVYSDWQLADIGEYKNIFLPIEGIAHAIYYNKELFAQAGIALPQDRLLTGEEFLDIVRQLRQAGITPISEGVASGYAYDCTEGIALMTTIFRFAGPEKVGQLLKEQINFSDPDIVAALEFWKRVVDAGGYDAETLLARTLPEKIFAMTDGQAAMNFSGTWVYGKFGTTERDRGQVGVFDWFTVENGKGNNYYEIFWAAGYGINKHSKHLTEAKQFLQFLMTPAAAILWAKHVQAPYPVIVLEGLPSDALYGSLTRHRNDQEAYPDFFACPFLGSKALSNMWHQETVKLLTGENSVEEFVKNMNSRMQVK